MKLRYLVKHAGRNLIHAKSRTLLTSFAIAIGAFTLTLSLAAGEGLRQFAEHFLEKNVDPASLTIVKDKRTIDAAGGQNSEPAEYTTNDFTTSNGLTVGQMTEQDLKKIKTLPEIATITALYDIRPLYIMGSNGKKYSGLTGAYTPPNVIRTLVAGALPKAGADIGLTEIIIPERFVKSFGFRSPQEAIGKSITIRYEGYLAPDRTTVKDYTFTIRAVTKKSLNVFEVDTGFMMAHATTKTIALFQKDPKKELTTIWSIATLTKGVDMNAGKRAVEALGYGAATPRDQGAAIFSIVDALSMATIIFGIITIIASVFGVINTQYISVLQRTQYIGLMKAMGMSNAQILRLFIFEAGLIGCLGGSIGIGLACMLGIIVNVPVTAVLGFDKGMLLVFQPLSILSLFASLLLIAVIAGYLPARKAARLDPIVALRTE